MCIGAATVEHSMEASQKVQNRTAVRSSNPTAGRLSKGNETPAPPAHRSVVHGNHGRDTETTSASIDRGAEEVRRAHATERGPTTKRKETCRR